MRLLRGVLALILSFGLVLTVGTVVPDTALAAELVIDGATYDCTAAGLANAVGAAQSGDRITFDCGDDNVIDFTEGDTITIDKVLTINGANDSNSIALDGDATTNFFIIEATGDLTLRDIGLSNGTAEKGGAVYVKTNGSLTTETNVAFSDNSATDGDDEASLGSGGAIYVEAGGTVSLRGADFDDNYAEVEGGAIYLAESEQDYPSSLTVIDSFFSGNVVGTSNESSNSYGGVIAMSSGNLATITLSGFQHNRAERPGFGGAIYIQGSTLSVQDCEFEGNKADTGGAIAAEDSMLNLNRVLLDSNESWIVGGAVAATSSDVSIKLSQVRDNFVGGVDTLGGAIAVSAASNLTVSRSSFVTNAAYDDDDNSNGGAIASQSSVVTINASTFYNNYAAGPGSTIWSSDVEENDTPRLNLTWSTIVQTGAEEGDTPAGASLYINSNATLEGVILGSEGTDCVLGGNGRLTDSYTLSNDTSCSLDGMGSSNSVNDLGLATTEPYYSRGAGQSYLPLTSDSPAHNAGPSSCNTDVQEGPDTDQLGNPRPIGSLCDIGAIEIDNQPPEIEFYFFQDDIIYEGQTADFIALISDRADDKGGDRQETHLIDCDINDEIEPIAFEGESTACTYADNGFYYGQLIANDGWASTFVFFLAEVLNAVPTMTTIDAASTTPPSQPFTFQMHATDVPADTLMFTYNCGNGVEASTAEIGAANGNFSAQGTCTFTEDGVYTINAIATDDDGGVSEPPMTVEVSVSSFSSTLCADNWNGQLRYLENGACGRGETQIELPDDGPISLCVNNWNGAARMANACNRSEDVMIVDGDGTIGVCVNKWNDTMRVSDRCDRSEVERQL